MKILIFFDQKIKKTQDILKKLSTWAKMEVKFKIGEHSFAQLVTFNFLSAWKVFSLIWKEPLYTVNYIF